MRCQSVIFLSCLHFVAAYIDVLQSLPFHVFTQRRVWVTRKVDNSPVIFEKFDHTYYELTLNESFTTEFVSQNFPNDCIDVYQSKFFSGYCSVPDYCHATKNNKTQHTWYGSSVDICTGLNSLHSHSIVRRQLNVYNFDFSKFTTHFKTKYSISPKVIDLHEVKLVKYNSRGEKMFLIPYATLKYFRSSEPGSLMKIQPDLHLMHYTSIPFAALDQFYFDRLSHSVHSLGKLIIPHLIQFDAFVYNTYCGPPTVKYKNFKEVMEFMPIECTEKIYTDYNTSLCTDFFFSPFPAKLCPENIFEFQHDTSFWLSKMIRTKTQDVFSHLLTTTLDKLFTVIDYIFEKLLEFLAPLIDKLFRVLFKFITNTANLLLKFLIDETDSVASFLDFSVELISKLVFLIFSLLARFDQKFNLLEFVLVYSFIVHKFQLNETLSKVLLATLLFVFPLPRLYPSILTSICNILYNDEH